MAAAEPTTSEVKRVMLPPLNTTPSALELAIDTPFVCGKALMRIMCHCVIVWWGVTEEQGAFMHACIQHLMWTMIPYHIKTRRGMIDSLAKVWERPIAMPTLLTMDVALCAPDDRRLFARMRKHFSPNTVFITHTMRAQRWRNIRHNGNMAMAFMLKNAYMAMKQFLALHQKKEEARVAWAKPANCNRCASPITDDVTDDFTDDVNDECMGVRGAEEHCAECVACLQFEKEEAMCERRAILGLF
jgi:hypothetical protein